MGMMKKYFKQTIALLIAAVLFGTSSPAAFTYDELDSKTAVAGASVALSRYLENNKDAANVLKMLLPTVENTAVFRDKGAVDPAEAEGEILYKETKTGLVHVDYSLNIRALPTTMSDVVAVTGDMSELAVIGERTTGGRLWYKVTLYGETGYALSDFIELSKDPEEAEDEKETEASSEAEETQPSSLEETAESISETEAETSAEETVPATTVPETTQTPEETVPQASGLPKDFAIPGQDLNAVSGDVADMLLYYAAEVRYCLGDTYAAVQAENNPTRLFSVVVYVCDCLQRVIDIASEQGLSATKAAASNALAQVNETRASLSAMSGRSEAEMFAEINAEAQAKIDEENRRLEQEAAEAEAARRQAEAERIAAEQEAERRRQEAEQARLEAEERARREEEARRQAEEERRQQEIAASLAAEQEAAQQAETEPAVPENGGADDAARRAEELEAAAQQAEQEAADRRAEEEAARQEAENAQANAALAAQCASVMVVPPRKEGMNYNAAGLAIVAQAEPFTGWLPYVWGGTSLESGCDCSGFAMLIYARCGLVSQAWAANHGNYYSGSLRGIGAAVGVADMQPGDMICYEGHVAIYWGVDAAGNHRVIHEAAAGRTVEIGYVNFDRIITVRRLY